MLHDKLSAEEGIHFHKGQDIITRYEKRDNGWLHQVYTMLPGWYFYAFDKYGNLNLHFKVVNNHHEAFDSEITAHNLFVRRREVVHWQKLYQQAIDNMPMRVRNSKQWIRREKGTVPIGDYVKGRAHGTMMVNANGQVVELTKVQIEFGQRSLCRKILGIKHSMAFSSVCARGCKPRDPVRQKLLLRLAGESGNAYAWKKLREWKIAHLYKNGK